MSQNLIWDLESIFPGGSQSPQLAAFIDALEADITAAEKVNLPGPLTEASQSTWIETFQRQYDLAARLWHVRSFVGCLVSQDVKDERALQTNARLDVFGSRLGTMATRLSAAAADQPDAAWQALMATPELSPVAFDLSEDRERARQKMPPDMEALAGELATDGYHAWNRLYSIVSGNKQVEFEEDGATKPMSLYQLQNKFNSDPDREVRRRAFETFETAWGELASVCAEALNHQAGYRLTLYRHRGWDSILQEPLQNNRFSLDTLEAMWDAIGRRGDKLLDYFAAKARLLGIDKLTWYDVDAPVGSLETTFSFEEAGDFIVNNFKNFNGEIAEFCRMAINKRWIEAEDRPGKRAGGYCTGLPLLGESRIFMTFDGSYGSMSTMAHELGHAYHGWVMRDLPIGARGYTMSLAETASTFNQSVVTDASLKAADDDQTRLSLLNEKLNEATAFLMNIRARFDFERTFFAERAKKHLSVDELSALMVAAQKTAFHDGLAEDGYHPLFWASKLHFYITRAPFYNFPYTFGYLFSNGVYQRALDEGPGFKERYVALLRDTGSMPTENLVQTHLGVDLTRADFWESAVDRVLDNVDDFVALADKLA
jgi:pepF/M3 family oligoendopeptidase